MNTDRWLQGGPETHHGGGDIKHKLCWIKPGGNGGMCPGASFYIWNIVKGVQKLVRKLYFFHVHIHFVYPYLVLVLVKKIYFAMFTRWTTFSFSCMRLTLVWAMRWPTQRWHVMSYVSSMMSLTRRRLNSVPDRTWLVAAISYVFNHSTFKCCIEYLLNLIKLFCGIQIVCGF